jgi:phenylalanine-4-hydroxylase
VFQSNIRKKERPKKNIRSRFLAEMLQRLIIYLFIAIAVFFPCLNTYLRIVDNYVHIMKVSGTSAAETILAVISKNDLPVAYYMSKRRQLEYTLDQLNIMDHPIEIQRICREIVAVKKKIQQLDPKKGNY